MNFFDYQFFDFSQNIIQLNLLHTVVWEKSTVGNIREKKIRGKKFSSKQHTDEKFLTPNISYMYKLTCTCIQ